MVFLFRPESNKFQILVLTETAYVKQQLSVIAYLRN